MKQFTIGDTVTVEGLKLTEAQPDGSFLGSWEENGQTSRRVFPAHAWPLTVGNEREGAELEVISFESDGIRCSWDEGEAAFPTAVLKRKLSLSDLGQILG